MLPYIDWLARLERNEDFLREAERARQERLAVYAQLANKMGKKLGILKNTPLKSVKDLYCNPADIACCPSCAS